MAFPSRKSFIFVVVSIVCVVLIIQLASQFNNPVPSLKPTMVMSLTSLSTTSIFVNNNATLTVVLENKASQPYSVEFHIVGIFKIDETYIKFYDKTNGGLLLDPVWNGQNYTITYPQTRNMNPGEQWSISIIIQGLYTIGATYHPPYFIEREMVTFVIFLEVWADGALAARDLIQLSVTHE